VRLLIVLPGALGDVIRALPLLARIRRGRPAAEIGWAVEPLSAPLLAGHPWLDRVHRFARNEGVRAFPGFVAEVRAAGYEIALDLGRSIKSAFIARASGARLRVGFAAADGREAGWLFANRHVPVQGVGRSKLEQFLAFADALDLPPAPIEFGLAPTLEEAREADTLTAGLDGPLVAACVGSSCPSRRWFPERTAAVLRRLREEQGTSAVLLGTNADAGFARATLTEVDGGVRNLVGRTNIRQVLAVLARARLAFGPDSGALHLAAAVGTPALSLWGATSALRSTPFGCEALAVSGAAPCSPCFLEECPIGRVCMQSIASDTVARHAAAVLAQ
jgi:lipopolysaccharide heptosyltransferase I